MVNDHSMELPVTVCLSQFATLTEHFKHVACDSKHPLMTLSNPFTLQNWTLPLIEFITIGATVLLLVHAIRRYRRHGDPSNLVLWVTVIAAQILLEGVCYFPQAFGIEDTVGVVFAHNQFTVQLAFDRMPLYVPCVYVMFLGTAYALVQRTGVFQRYNPAIGAATVAFVMSALWASFDQVAPQLKWWAWNYDIPTGTPTFGVVPSISIQLFNVTLPFVLTLLTLLFCRKPNPSGRRVTGVIAAIMVLIWPGILLVDSIERLLNVVGVPIGVARQAVTYTVFIAAGATAVAAMVGAYRARLRGEVALPDWLGRDRLPVVMAVFSQVLLVILWVSALPDYFDAVDGLTAAGAHTGSLLFAVVNFFFGVGFVIVAIIHPANVIPASSTLQPEPLAGAPL